MTPSLPFHTFLYSHVCPACLSPSSRVFKLLHLTCLPPFLSLIVIVSRLARFSSSHSLCVYTRPHSSNWLVSLLPFPYVCALHHFVLSASLPLPVCLYSSNWFVSLPPFPSCVCYSVWPAIFPLYPCVCVIFPVSIASAPLSLTLGVLHWQPRHSLSTFNCLCVLHDLAHFFHLLFFCLCFVCVTPSGSLFFYHFPTSFVCVT